MGIRKKYSFKSYVPIIFLQNLFPLTANECRKVLKCEYFEAEEIMINSHNYLFIYLEIDNKVRRFVVTEKELKYFSKEFKGFYGWE